MSGVRSIHEIHQGNPLTMDPVRVQGRFAARANTKDCTTWMRAKDIQMAAATVNMVRRLDSHCRPRLIPSSALMP